MGDENGGSGWTIVKSGGTTDRYYIDLPSEIGETTVRLAEAPEEYRDLPASQLVSRYLDRLEVLVSEANQRFAP
jgi:hypothetical protein